MKFWLLIILMGGLVIASRAAVMWGTYRDPKYPGKCVVGDLIVSPGEEAKNPFSPCGQLFCGDDGVVVFHTCGTILPPKGHKLGDAIEPNAAYPQCCDRHIIHIDKNIQ